MGLTGRSGQAANRNVGDSCDTCPHMPNCHKTRYRDRIAALLALATVQSQDKSHRPKLEQRAYFCADCRSWHLTSQRRRTG